MTRTTAVAGPVERRWPAEWAPHRATWLAWPHNAETWPGHLSAVEDAFCEIVRGIAAGEQVEILVADPAEEQRVRAKLAGAGVTPLEPVRFRGIATDDAWIRDFGGVFVFERKAGGEGGPPGRWRRRLLDFGFDAWGGKYPPWERDQAVAEQMAGITRVERAAVAHVLEGGSIDGDGQGTLLTTESCLRHPNRGPIGVDRSPTGLEAMLHDTLGAKRVIWLGDGIAGDDTDGHIDDLARFVAPGRVVCALETDREDANFAALADARQRLAAARDAQGRALEVIELPMPRPLAGAAGRLPASYANFYIANAATLVPVFDDPADAEALAILGKAIDDRPVVPIPSRDLVIGLGAVHCLTQQEPASPA